MNSTTRFTLITAFSILALFAGLSLINLTHNNSAKVPQDFQKAFLEGKLQLPSGKPQRIISLSPSITEILYALEAGDRIAGVTSYSDYPEEAKTKPSVGEYQTPDIEKIISLRPDLVIGTGDTKENFQLILARSGIPVITIDPKSLPEIITAIDLISVAIDEKERGSILHEKLTSQMNSVQYQLRQKQSKRIFLEIWDAPLLTIGGKSFMNDLVFRAGGQNVAAGIQADYTPSDMEALYAYNPDIYVVVTHNNNNIRSLIVRPELANLTAVQNKQVYQLTSDVLTRPGPRSFQGLLQLAKIIHPDVIQNGEVK